MSYKIIAQSVRELVASFSSMDIALVDVRQLEQKIDFFIESDSGLRIFLINGDFLGKVLDCVRLHSDKVLQIKAYTLLSMVASNGVAGRDIYANPQFMKGVNTGLRDADGDVKSVIFKCLTSVVRSLFVEDKLRLHDRVVSYLSANVRDENAELKKSVFMFLIEILPDKEFLVREEGEVVSRESDGGTALNSIAMDKVIMNQCWSFLDSPDPELQKMALSLLKKIAGYQWAADRIFKDERFSKVMLKLGTNDLDVQLKAVLLLCNLVDSISNPAETIDAEFLLAISRNVNDRNRRATIAVLGVLSARSPDLCRLIFNIEPVREQVVSWAKSTENKLSEVTFLAIKLLQDLASSNREIERIVCSEYVVDIVGSVLEHPDPSVQLESFLLLAFAVNSQVGRVYMRNEESVKRLLDKYRDVQAVPDNSYDYTADTIRNVVASIDAILARDA